MCIRDRCRYIQPRECACQRLTLHRATPSHILYTVQQVRGTEALTHVPAYREAAATIYHRRVPLYSLMLHSITTTFVHSFQVGSYPAFRGRFASGEPLGDGRFADPLGEPFGEVLGRFATGEPFGDGRGDGRFADPLGEPFGDGRGEGRFPEAPALGSTT